MFKSGHKVIIQGQKGMITAIYPNGNGNYIGKQHAFYIVVTGSQFFCKTDREWVHNKLSVSFNDDRLMVLDDDFKTHNDMVSDRRKNLIT